MVAYALFSTLTNHFTHTHTNDHCEFSPWLWLGQNQQVHGMGLLVCGVWVMSTGLGRSHGQTATLSLRNQLFQTICLNLTLTHPVHPCVQLRVNSLFKCIFRSIFIKSISLTYKLHISIRTGGRGNPRYCTQANLTQYAWLMTPKNNKLGFTVGTHGSGDGTPLCARRTKAQKSQWVVLDVLSLALFLAWERPQNQCHAILLAAEKDAWLSYSLFLPKHYKGSGLCS